MPITLQCPCGKVLQANDSDAGKQAQCPACGQMLTVPFASEPSEYVPPMSVPERAPMPAPPPMAGPEYTCSVCRGRFNADDVYDERGRIICKRCYAQGGPPPAEWEPRRMRRPHYDYGYSGPANISSHLAEAILVTIFCCLPFGIVAIVYAANVNSKIQTGDYQGAQADSTQAATWCWISFGIGLGGILIYFFILMANGMAWRGAF
jgi:hypothetical protein